MGETETTTVIPADLYSEFFSSYYCFTLTDVTAAETSPWTLRVAFYNNKMLSYRRETALQGTLVLVESGRLELRDNILLIL